MSVDPLTPKYPQWSPYQFGGNQVIHTTELEGLEPGKDLCAHLSPDILKTRENLGGIGSTADKEFLEAFERGKTTGLYYGAMVGIAVLSPVDEFYLLGRILSYGGKLFHVTKPVIVGARPFSKMIQGYGNLSAETKRILEPIADKLADVNTKGGEFNCQKCQEQSLNAIFGKKVSPVEKGFETAADLQKYGNRPEKQGKLLAKAFGVKKKSVFGKYWSKSRSLDNLKSKVLNQLEDGDVIGMSVSMSGQGPHAVVGWKLGKDVFIIDSQSKKIISRFDDYFETHKGITPYGGKFPFTEARHMYIGNVKPK